MSRMLLCDQESEKEKKIQNKLNHETISRST